MPLWGTEDTAAAKPQIGGRSQNAIKARDYVRQRLANADHIEGRQRLLH